MADDQTIQQDIPQPQEQQTGGGDPLQSLYDNLHKSQLYTKTYDEFKQKYSDPKAIDDLYGKLNQLQLYTKGKTDFYNKYFPSSQSQPFVEPKVEFSEPTYKARPAIGVRQFSFDKQKDESDKVLDQVKLQNQGQIAKNNLTSILQGSNDVAQHLLGVERMQKLQQLKSAADNGDMNALAEYHHESANIPFPGNQVAETEQKKQELLSDPNKTRLFAGAVAALHPSKAVDIKTNLYQHDASLRNADYGTVQKNIERIKNGDLDYNIQNGQVEKQVNPIESFINGWKHKSKLFDDYDFIKSASDQELADKYEKRRTTHNPDEPLEKPSSTLGDITELFASQPTKAMIAEGVLSAIPGAEEAAPLAGATIGAFDYGRMGQAAAMEQIYNEARNQGKSSLEAAHLAKIESQKSGDIDALQGAAMTGMAGKFGGKGLPNFSSGYENAVKTFLKQTGGEAATMAALGAGGQFAKNKLAQAAGIERPTSEGMLDQIKTNFLMTAGIKAAMQGGKFVQPIIHGLSKVDPEVFDNHLQQQVAEREISNIDATKLKVAVGDQKVIDNLIPDDIDETSRLKIGAKIRERNILKNHLETTDEAFHPDIKERIKGLNEDIIGLSKNKVEAVPKGNIDQQTLQQALEKKEIKGAQSDVAEMVLSKNDPEQIKQFYKEVADQALNKIAPDASPSDNESYKQAVDTYGQSIVDHSIKLYPKTETNESKAKAETQTEGGLLNEKQDAGEKSVTNAEPASSLIKPTTDFRTWDLGDMEGKPEDEAAKKHIEGVVREWDTKPAGTKGETFGGFVNRVIPSFDKILKEEPNNTTITTHSSVLKAFKVWDEMGRPDVDKLTPEQKTEFAKKYNQSETHNGDLETFKGDKGDIHVVRHGQTEDNAKNNFRSGNTNLTDKGIKQAHEVAEQLKEKTSGGVPKIISSDLPRAIHTSNIITEHLKPTEDAIHQQSTKTVGAHDNGNSGTGRPVEGQGMGSGQQGEGITGESTGTGQEDKGTGEKAAVNDLPFIGRTGESVGISHGSAEARATDVPVLPPERGEGVTVEEAIQHGQDLLSKGGDAEKAAADFKSDKKISYDALSLVRAKHADLAKATNAAIDKYGEGSKEAQSAIKAESNWYKNTVKPMQTEWSKIGQAQQGETDIDTGSYMGMKRAFMQETGKEPSAQQAKEAKGLSGKVQGLTKQVEDLKQQLSDALDKATSEGVKASKPKSEKKTSGDYIKERKDALQAARDALKQLRTGQSGLGSTVPFARELAAIAPHVAKIVKSLIEEGIDKLSDIVDYVHEQFKDDIQGVRRRDIIDVVAGDYNKQAEVNPNDKLTDIRKQSRLVKQLEDLQNGLPKDFDKNKVQQSPEVQALLDKIKKVKKDLDDMGYMKPSKKQVSPEEKNINRLEKELEDLQQGIVKEKAPTREQSNREKELKEQIFEAKKNLGLIEPKDLPEEPHIRALEKKLEDLRAGKKANKGSERDISAQERVLQDQIKEAQNTAKANELSTRFVNKKGSDFDPQDAKDIWDYAKENYLNKGKDFDTMIHGTAMDLGLTPEQVRNALTQPKGTKTITDEMYKKQYYQQQAIQQAKAWVKSSNTPALIKALKFIPHLFFRLKTFGHGTVGGITHAGMNIFRPSDWKSYWPSFFKQFKFAFGKTSDYQKAMSDLTNDKDFIFWKRAGLAVDPTERYDDYQTFDKLLGRLGAAGDRGFNALKVMRLQMAKAEFERLSDVEKADPETIKNIASIVNHATGTSKIPVPEGVGIALFAPRLEASRWSRLIMQPAQAVKTVLSWDKASIADKAAAKIVAKRSGEIIAGYLAALAANQGVLWATGSKQNINFTDPTSPDWLKFKIADRTVDLSGGMVSALGFITSMIHIASESQSDLKGKKRGDELVNKGGRYLRGKLSPFGSTVADVTTQHDFAGNTMPFSSDKPTSQFAHELTWKEYLLGQQTPIPVSESIKDATDQMKERGMSDADINTVMQAILVGATAGGIGARVGTDYSLEPKQQTVPTSKNIHTHKTPKHR